jgi:polysaccharide export outer membrane protein
VRTTKLAALLLLGTGCFLAPGMRMNERAAEARAREHYGPRAEESRYQVRLLDTKIVSQLVAERRWAVGNPLPDPLVKEARNYVYRVAPNDVLSVTVWDHPELTIPAGQYRTPESSGNLVEADGTIFYPHVGTIHVAGKTLPEIRTILAQRLSVYVKNPQLDVRVAAFRGKKVQVTGEVVAPGTLPITDVPMRVQDAIAQVHGPGSEADLQHVTLTRDGQVYQLNLLATYELGDSSQNWLLRDGDIVNVPDRNLLNKVIVMGEVRVPAARVMTKGRLTLAEAVGDLGGLNTPLANPAKIYVIRGDFDAPAIYKLDASSADAFLLATQFPLLPRDVVYVSTYELSRWNNVLSQILPTIQAVWQSYDLSRASGIVRPIR